MLDEKRKRLKKYTREKPENLPPRRITPRSIEIIDIIHRYKFIPTSLIVRLVDGDIRTTERHLQNLYHQRLINRFAFPSTYYPTEFNYYLDTRAALKLLIDNNYKIEEADYEVISNNREKDYCTVTMGREMVKMQGRLMHLHHELMISRFHYMVEKACDKSGDKVKLLGFYQGSQLWNNIEVSKVYYDRDGRLIESDATERLPHRPDAFFALHFPDREGDEQTQCFFYEADRKTTSVKKMQKKLRAHFHYIVKQKKHVEDYGVNRIRAVLVESTEDHWTNTLRTTAGHPTVSGSKPSPLFWFTPSDLAFEKLIPVTIKGAEKHIPIYLEKPELVFAKIWATPAESDDNPVFQSLID
ncbi:MAG: replication-relaxation family protein [Acidobacteria bacterium]|nr:replication-relaxation family protein [Acidobacteriota bacterium]